MYTFYQFECWAIPDDINLPYLYLIVDIIVAIQHETALTQQAVAELHEPDYQNTTEILTTNENNAGDATDDQETTDEIVFINKSHWQY